MIHKVAKDITAFSRLMSDVLWGGSSKCRLAISVAQSALSFGAEV